MRGVAIVVTALLVTAACASDDPDDPDDPAGTATVATARPATTPPPMSVATSTIPSSPSVTSSGPAWPSPTSAQATVAPDAVVPEGFGQVAATATMADGTVCELCLWLADDDDLRSRGLMHVTDLGGADGMLFRYPGPTTAAFWMKNTVMPLSIAFFGADGAHLGSFDMEPCTADPCPTYPTPADFVDAIEVPQGGLAERGLAPGSTLVVHDAPCPLA